MSQSSPNSATETLQGGVSKDASQIGQRIREARKTLGLNQRDFSARIGKHYNTVAAWEAGSSLPDLSVGKALARELGVPFLWLATGEGDPASKDDPIPRPLDLKLFTDTMRVFVHEEDAQGSALDAEKAWQVFLTLCKLTLAIGRTPEPDLVSQIFKLSGNQG
ncbi:MAG: helix-turn-helix domain-containing protein [Pseudomonadota bacterium]